MSDFSFVDFAPDDPRLAELLPVLLELRPHLTPESFRAVYQEGYPQGLRFTAAYDDGSCVAVAGWRIFATTFAMRKLHVDDLVTAADRRSEGFGRALIRELERRAREAGCDWIDLDSAVTRRDAHRFYARERYAIVAFHFARALDESA